MPSSWLPSSSAAGAATANCASWPRRSAPWVTAASLLGLLCCVWCAGSLERMGLGKSCDAPACLSAMRAFFTDTRAACSILWRAQSYGSVNAMLRRIASSACSAPSSNKRMMSCSPAPPSPCPAAATPEAVSAAVWGSSAPFAAAVAAAAAAAVILPAHAAVAVAVACNRANCSSKRSTLAASFSANMSCSGPRTAPSPGAAPAAVEASGVAPFSASQPAPSDAPPCGGSTSRHRPYGAATAAAKVVGRDGALGGSPHTSAATPTGRFGFGALPGGKVLNAFTLAYDGTPVRDPGMPACKYLLRLLAAWLNPPSVPMCVPFKSPLPLPLPSPSPPLPTSQPGS